MLMKQPMTHRLQRLPDQPRAIADITARDLLLTIIGRTNRPQNVTLVYKIHRLMCHQGRQLNEMQLKTITGLKPVEIKRLLAALELSHRYERHQLLYQL